MLSVFMLILLMLIAFVLIFFMLLVLMLSSFMLTVLILGVFMLKAVMQVPLCSIFKTISLREFHILCVIVLSLIMLSVLRWEAIGLGAFCCVALW